MSLYMVYVPCVCLVPEEARPCVWSLELKLKAVMNHHGSSGNPTWLGLGLGLGLERATSTLNH